MSKVIKYNSNSYHISNDLISSYSKKDEVIQVTSKISKQDILSYLELIEGLKQYFVGDKYGNSPLSLSIEESKMSQVREMYPVEKDLSDAEVLKRIALDITDTIVQQDYDISQEVALRIYSEAVDQLNLMGEDTSAVVDAYNFS